MTTTREVFEAHVNDLRKNNISAVAAGYAEDAVMVANGEIYNGRDAIRALFAANEGSRLLDAGSGLTTSVVDSGDVVFVSWFTGNSNHPTIVGTDTFVIRDGLIVVHTGFNARV